MTEKRQEKRKEKIWKKNLNLAIAREPAGAKETNKYEQSVYAQF